MNMMLMLPSINLLPDTLPTWTMSTGIIMFSLLITVTFMKQGSDVVPDPLLAGATLFPALTVDGLWQLMWQLLRLQNQVHL